MDDSGECHRRVIKGVMHSIFSVLQCLDETGAGNCFLRDYCIFFDTNTKNFRLFLHVELHLAKIFLITTTGNEDLGKYPCLTDSKFVHTSE
jgi:hypothetical protein